MSDVPDRSVEIKYFSKECETGSRGLEPFFESGWWQQIVNHDVQTADGQGSHGPVAQHE